MNSVTPDFERRLQRARDLTSKIVEIKKNQTGGQVYDISKAGEIAQKLGVYDRLGVTKSRVIQSIGSEDLKE